MSREGSRGERAENSVTQFLDNEQTINKDFSLTLLVHSIPDENESYLREGLAKKIEKGTVYASSIGTISNFNLGLTFKINDISVLLWLSENILSFKKTIVSKWTKNHLTQFVTTICFDRSKCPTTNTSCVLSFKTQTSIWIYILLALWKMKTFHLLNFTYRLFNLFLNSKFVVLFFTFRIELDLYFHENIETLLENNVNGKKLFLKSLYVLSVNITFIFSFSKKIQGIGWIER